jgi:integrase
VFSIEAARSRSATARLELELMARPSSSATMFVGHVDLATTANTYTHVLADETELDYAELLA